VRYILASRAAVAVVREVHVSNVFIRRLDQLSGIIQEVSRRHIRVDGLI
jgi:hypothetical protein